MFEEKSLINTEIENKIERAVNEHLPDSFNTSERLFYGYLDEELISTFPNINPLKENAIRKMEEQLNEMYRIVSDHPKLRKNLNNREVIGLIEDRLNNESNLIGYFLYEYSGHLWTFFYTSEEELNYLKITETKNAFRKDYQRLKQKIYLALKQYIEPHDLIQLSNNRIVWQTFRFANRNEICAIFKIEDNGVTNAISQFRYK